MQPGGSREDRRLHEKAGGGDPRSRKLLCEHVPGGAFRVRRAREDSRGKADPYRRQPGTSYLQRKGWPEGDRGRSRALRSGPDEGALSRGARGGPERRTQIVELASGDEERNASWANSRRRYDVAYGIRRADDLAAVVAFFEERRGRLYGFRWRDPLDWKSCPPSATPSASDQEIGIGDGSTRTFALVKSYGSSQLPWVRRLTKPVAGSVRVSVAGVEIAAAEFSVDATTGLVTLAAAPAAGASVKAGFLFDTPARFDADYLEIDQSGFEAGEIPKIPILEILS